MTKKNKVNVTIDGRNFTVVGDGTEEYVRKLALYVDEKIKDLTSKNDRLSSSMAATLAALNISDELFKTSEELKKLKQETKVPMESYNEILRELEEVKEKNEELAKQCNVYKDELLDAKRDNERLAKDIEKYNQIIELKEKELQESQKMIKKLQDKIFDSQMELIEIKKELEEALKLYDNEKNIFSREEV
ncbi:MAG: cell division protein ZapA [Tissierellia bacterium]|nr:cell division protein ZapA [Tissierellia bacterium]